MRKVKTKNGFTRLVFEAGDGALVRWNEPMQAWRAEAPERRRLAHAVSWYFDGERLAARPLLGLLSLSKFAERNLWDALTKCEPGGHAAVSAQRLMLAVQRKMAQMRYRGRNKRVQRPDELAYLRSCARRLAGLARKSRALVEEELELRRLERRVLGRKRFEERKYTR